ncbi:hypothetical protein [Streptomyces sp. NPDC055210]
MNIYSQAFHALTSGQPLSETDAKSLLGQLRQEFGQELADAAERQIDGEYEPTDTDTSSAVRIKRHKRGAAVRTVYLIRQLAKNPRGFTPPTQRDPRSTS